MTSTAEAKPDINKNNIAKSTARGILQYQHRDYFQDKLIPQIVSRVVSNR